MLRILLIGLNYKHLLVKSAKHSRFPQISLECFHNNLIKPHFKEEIKNSGENGLDLSVTWQ